MYNLVCTVDCSMFSELLLRERKEREELKTILNVNPMLLKFKNTMYNIIMHEYMF